MAAEMHLQDVQEKFRDLSQSESCFSTSTPNECQETCAVYTHKIYGRVKKYSQFI